MNVISKKARPSVRADFVPADGYVSPEIVQLEKDKLWPRVWLIAAREQQLKQPGDFVRFDIADESIVILRNRESALRAYYNVCQHRGRRLVDAESGNLGSQFICRFHAWRYDLEGVPTYIRNKEDWENCENFSESALSLKRVRVDTWAGWIWITMDPDIEDLASYLDPIPKLYKNYEFEDCRIGWYKTVVTPCNWKTVMDAFNEGYHAEGTHPQMAKYGGTNMRQPAVAVGRHTCIQVNRNDTSTEGSVLRQSSRDLRVHLFAIGRELQGSLHALYTEHFVAAAKRLEQELSETSSPSEVMQSFKRFHQEEMERVGAKWPSITDVEVNEAGGTWHIFPNTIVLSAFDGALWYRARPNGNDPDSCLFDIWWLGRYAEGKEPPLQHDLYENPSEFSGQNPFLEQDFGNLGSVQLGMKSRGFSGGRTSPVQEVAVSHLHDVLYDYIFDDARTWYRRN